MDSRQGSTTNGSLVPRWTVDHSEPKKTGAKSTVSRKVSGAPSTSGKPSIQNMHAKSLTSKGDAKVAAAPSQEGASLKDLCVNDKRRLATLIKELADVTESRELAIVHLQEERVNFERKLYELKQLHDMVFHSREGLELQYHQSQELLQMYRNQLVNQEGALADLQLQQQTHQCHPHIAKDLSKKVQRSSEVPGQHSVSESHVALSVDQERQHTEIAKTSPSLSHAHAVKSSAVPASAALAPPMRLAAPPSNVSAPQLTLTSALSQGTHAPAAVHSSSLNKASQGSELLPASVSASASTSAGEVVSDGSLTSSITSGSTSSATGGQPAASPVSHKDSQSSAARHQQQAHTQRQCQTSSMRRKVKASVKTLTDQANCRQQSAQATLPCQHRLAQQQHQHHQHCRHQQSDRQHGSKPMYSAHQLQQHLVEQQLQLQELQHMLLRQQQLTSHVLSAESGVKQGLVESDTKSKHRKKKKKKAKHESCDGQERSVHDIKTSQSARSRESNLSAAPDSMSDSLSHAHSRSGIVACGKGPVVTAPAVAVHSTYNGAGGRRQKSVSSHCLGALDISAIPHVPSSHGATSLSISSSQPLKATPAQRLPCKQVIDLDRLEEDLTVLSILNERCALDQGHTVGSTNHAAHRTGDALHQHSSEVSALDFSYWDSRLPDLISILAELENPDGLKSPKQKSSSLLAASKDYPGSSLDSDFLGRHENDLCSTLDIALNR